MSRERQRPRLRGHVCSNAVAAAVSLQQFPKLLVKVRLFDGRAQSAIAAVIYCYAKRMKIHVRTEKSGAWLYAWRTEKANPKKCRCGARRQIRNQCRACHSAYQRSRYMPTPHPEMETRNLGLMPFSEIGRRLGITASAAESTCKRAIIKLFVIPKSRREMNKLRDLVIMAAQERQRRIPLHATGERDNGSESYLQPPRREA